MTPLQSLWTPWSTTGFLILPWWAKLFLEFYETEWISPAQATNNVEDYGHSTHLLGATTLRSRNAFQVWRFILRKILEMFWVLSVWQTFYQRGKRLQTGWSRPWVRECNQTVARLILIWNLNQYSRWGHRSLGSQSWKSRNVSIYFLLLFQTILKTFKKIKIKKAAN